jgi:hypothetical protein
MGYGCGLVGVGGKIVKFGGAIVGALRHIDSPTPLDAIGRHRGLRRASRG